MTTRGAGQGSSGGRNPSGRRTSSRSGTVKNSTGTNGTGAKSASKKTKGNGGTATGTTAKRPPTGTSTKTTAKGSAPSRNGAASGGAGPAPKSRATSANASSSGRAQPTTTSAKSPTKSRAKSRAKSPAKSPAGGPPRRRGPARVRLATGPLRIRFLLVMVAVVMSLFAGRLIQLQGLDASTYAAAAREIGVTTEPLVAARGDIVDRNGQPLAATSEAYHLYVDQTAVTNPAAYALQLGEVLDRDLASLQSAVTGDSPFHYVAKSISGAQWREIQALELRGIGADPIPERSYPQETVAGNIVGFIGSDGDGLAGLEQSYDGTLAGVNGQSTYQLGPGGQRIPSSATTTVDEPEQGTGLALTIDRDLQWYAEKALADAVKNADAADGAAVVMDAETFEVVAMAGTPRMDPEEPASVEAADRGNKAVQYAYEPGSVFKPLTLAAVIDAGVAGPASVYSVPDAIERSGEVINDHYNHAEQPMTLAGILANSSNVGTLLAAEDLGSEAFHDYLTEFGIGRPTDLGLPAETGGSLAADMSDLTRDNIAFGQGVAVNIVQMATAYATIANGGVRQDPSLVAGHVDADGEVVPADRSEGTPVISEETADAVTDMMETVMGPDGTGSPAAVEGYRVAGKTGTSQRVDPDCGCYRDYDLSFMGFAPADDPKYVVAVSLFDTTHNSGGQYAGPTFADIMGFALERAGVAPSGTEPDYLPVAPE